MSLSSSFRFGYQLFNNLAYVIESQAIFSGPNDFAFRIPSAATSKSFNDLRILFAEYDSSDPKKPRWRDATVIPGSPHQVERYLSRDELNKLLPDFNTRTLHAVMEEAPRIYQPEK